MKGYCLMCTDFQFCKMKAVLKIGGDNGYPTVWIYLTLLSWKLKMVRMVNDKFYIVCNLLEIKNEEKTQFK